MMLAFPSLAAASTGSLHKKPLSSWCELMEADRRGWRAGTQPLQLTSPLWQCSTGWTEEGEPGASSLLVGFQWVPSAAADAEDAANAGRAAPCSLSRYKPQPTLLFHSSSDLPSVLCLPPHRLIGLIAVQLGWEGGRTGSRWKLLCCFHSPSDHYPSHCWAFPGLPHLPYYFVIC